MKDRSPKCIYYSTSATTMVSRSPTSSLLLLLLLAGGLPIKNGLGFLLPRSIRGTRLPPCRWSSCSTNAKKTVTNSFPTTTTRDLTGNDDDECSLESDNASDCIKAQGPYYRRDTSEYVTVQEVLVAQVDTLRGRFPSFEKEGDQGSNMMKYNKHNRGFYTLPPSAASAESNATGTTTTIMGETKTRARDTSGDRTSLGTHQVNVEYTTIIGDEELVLVDTLRKPGMKSISRAFQRAGPRKLLHFEPSTVNAAIVTCGGLCPVSRDIDVPMR